MALRLRYQTIEFGETDIHVCALRDKQEFSDPLETAEEIGISSSQWSLFGVLWPSSLVLANYMHEYIAGDKRILEIGCGLALASLLLNSQHADITATDYHPEVEFFLNRNALLNNNKNIPFERTDWAKETDSLGEFDVIIGSDLLYEDQHVTQLANFINNHAKNTCEVILVDPGRGRKNKISKQLTEHGFSNTHTKPTHTNYLDTEFKGYILKFNRLASI